MNMNSRWQDCGRVKRQCRREEEEEQEEQEEKRVLHVASNARISICIPGAANARFPLEYAELIETEL